MERILENLWQVGGGDFTGPGDAAIYLIRFGDEAALVDAGCGHGHEALKSNIIQCLPDNVALTYLLLTHSHFDHAGGASAVRRDFGCRIVAHELDAAYLESGNSEVTAASWYGTQMEPLSIDLKLTGGENMIRIGGGEITAIHWPGHSPGSVVYTAQLDGLTILFGQDVHGPIHPSLLSDADEYQESLQKMLSLKADLLCEGHFGVLHGKDKVREFIRSFIIE